MKAPDNFHDHDCRSLTDSKREKPRVKNQIGHPAKSILLTIKSNFKPNLVSPLGEGGQAKVFKAEFHGEDVAMKYIPLDKVKDNYEYKFTTYGCNELWSQEEFSKYKKALILRKAGMHFNTFPFLSIGLMPLSKANFSSYS